MTELTKAELLSVLDDVADALDEGDIEAARDLLGLDDDDDEVDDDDEAE
jgi:hypothetical protein